MEMPKRQISPSSRQRCNVRTFVLAVPLLGLLTGCYAGDPEFVAYTADSQCVMIGMSCPQHLLIHHVPTGKTGEFEGSVYCVDPSGTRWIIHPAWVDEAPWELVKLQPDGSMTPQTLPTVPGSPRGGFGCHHLAFAFGPDPGEITAGVAKNPPGTPVSTAFYSLKPGHAQWTAVQPPSVIGDLIISRMAKPSRDGLDAPDSILRVECCDGRILVRFAGSKAKVIKESIEESGNWASEHRVDSPDGKTFVTLKVKTEHGVRIVPGAVPWAYYQLEWTVTDTASGKTRTIRALEPGQYLFDHVGIPILELIILPVAVMTYVDA
jgi:hypothetical protein